MNITDPKPNRRILIVDDNTDAAQSMEILLKGLQHETRIAYGGLEALHDIDASFEAGQYEARVTIRQGRNTVTRVARFRVK